MNTDEHRFFKREEFQRKDAKTQRGHGAMNTKGDYKWLGTMQTEN
jgi:hypothetical protein